MKSSLRTLLMRPHRWYDTTSEPRRCLFFLCGITPVIFAAQVWPLEVYPLLGVLIAWRIWALNQPPSSTS